MKAAVLALLLAYIPSTGSLLKRAGGRSTFGSRTREVTLSGMLTVSGEPARRAQLVLRFPLSCRLDADGGVSLSVKGTADRPAESVEGPSGPALRLLQLACPFIAYRGLRADDAEVALRAAAVAQGVDLMAGTALARLIDRVVYVLGAAPRDPTRPQFWLYKDTHAPARLLAQGGADLRLLQYGNPAAADWFPRVLELWLDGRLAARFESLEARGSRDIKEEEEDDSRE